MRLAPWLALALSACGRSMVFGGADFLAGDGGDGGTGGDGGALITRDDCQTFGSGASFPVTCDPRRLMLGGDGESVLACGRTEPTEVTVQRGNVYWAETTGIVAFAPIAGGQGHVLDCSDGFVWHLTSDAQHLYWSQMSPGTPGTESGIFGLPLGGGTRESISESPQPTTLVVLGSNLFWPDYITQQIESLDLVTLVELRLAAQQPDVICLAANATAVYWADYEAGQVWKLGLQAEATPILLASNQAGPVAITVNSHGIFWADDQGGGEMSPNGVIMQLDETSGAGPQVVASPENTPATMVSDDDAVYWTSNSYNLGNPGGMIRKLSMAPGSQPTTLVGNETNPQQPIIAGGYVYWANTGDGTIRRIAK